MAKKKRTPQEGSTPAAGVEAVEVGAIEGPGEAAAEAEAKKDRRPPARPTAADGAGDPASGADGPPAELPEDGRPFGVVGVGASAGGLSSYTELLGHLPADTGLAFVLVQHLERSHESRLAEILSKATPMPVVEAFQGAAIEPDHVYVIPPNTTMLLSGGRLALEPRPAHGQPMPIDLFFRSLAMEKRGRAAGVILSGSGTDGTLGLEAIKAEGGFTFAESQGTAEHGEMPRSAAGTGSVDLVLPPAEIGREIARLAKRMASADVAAELAGAPEDEGDLKKIFALLRNSKGVDFTSYRQTTIKRRIIRRMLLHKVHRVGDYLALVRERPSEIEALYQDVLIRVTSFFRDPEVFEALKASVLPALIGRKRTQDAPIRVWVPGCATGEEAYSLAICLSEYMVEHRLSCPIQLFGTDVSDTTLEKARVGAYLENIALDVSPERLRRYFSKVGAAYQISQSIRDSCIFARQNVASDPPFSKLDLISCRNVLIYLSPVLQKKVLPAFHYALKPGGFLVLGSSETAGNTAELFDAVDKKHKIYAKAPGAPRLGFELPLQPRVTAPGAEARPPDRAGDPEPQNLHREADSVALARYAPAGVIVNREMQIVEFRGQTGPYLEPAPGEPSHHLLKMAREGLALELRTLLHKAEKSGEPVRSGVVEFRSNGGTREAIIDVTPLRTGLRDGEATPRHRYLLVSFEQPPAGPPPEAAPPARGAKKKPRGAQEAPAAESREVTRLRQELAATREYLQSIIEEMEATNEELQSANEEILSSNEELQSINEELETAKEELQSTNEELTTVNEELRSRNAELSQANNDLNNSLSSVSLPIIMLDADLRIRRVTPAAERVLHLIPTDVGRPISDIRQKIDIPDLEAILAEVIEGTTSVTRDVQDRDGRWFSMRVRPYRTSENKIEGAVLTLVDIDESRRALEALQATHLYAEALLETVHEPLVVLDEALRVVRANATFCETFGVAQRDAEGKFIYEVGEGPWDIHSLRVLLEEILPKNKVLREYRVEHTFPGLGPRVFLLNARQVHRTEGPSERILLAFRDVTGRAPS